jgi:hypothetical protein
LDVFARITGKFVFKEEPRVQTDRDQFSRLLLLLEKFAKNGANFTENAERHAKQLHSDLSRVDQTFGLQADERLTSIGFITFANYVPERPFSVGM